MKKIISILLLITINIFSIPFTIAQNSIVVSAVVGNINQAPVIINYIPDAEPWILERSTIQNYTIYFRDTEKNTVYYSITPDNGYANPISGVINQNNYDSQSGAYINFVYLAPPGEYPDEKITITLNDGANVVYKDLYLYIY